VCGKDISHVHYKLVIRRAILIIVLDLCVKDFVAGGGDGTHTL